MIEAPPTYRKSIRYVTAIDGTTTEVTLSGPVSDRTVILIDKPTDPSAACDTLRERLHVARFRTVAIPAYSGLTAKSIVGFLDQLRIAGGLLVGDSAGAELAWDLAATYRERFTGLLVIDCGHPAVPGVEGSIRDRTCPAVDVDTTIMASSRFAYAVASASRRHVHGDFRMVELSGPRGSRHFIAQLATEIVVRALSR